jgi:hypothetical protein
MTTNVVGPGPLKASRSLARESECVRAAFFTQVARKIFWPQIENKFPHRLPPSECGGRAIFCLANQRPGLFMRRLDSTHAIFVTREEFLNGAYTIKCQMPRDALY